MQIPQNHGIALPLARFELLKVDRLSKWNSIRLHRTSEWQWKGTSIFV